MTFPSVVKDLLMFAPSFKRCPVAPVEFALSDPAKSTKLVAMTVRIVVHTCPKYNGPDPGNLFGV